MKKYVRLDAVSLTLSILMLTSSIMILTPTTVLAAPNTMSFTTGNTISFGSTVEMTSWSGVSMTFGTNITIQFLDPDLDLMLAPCDWIQITFPAGYILPPCTWWEVIDPAGSPLGEFHADVSYPGEFHIDMVLDSHGVPGVIFLQFPPPYTAVMKIDTIMPCRYYTVHTPAHWYPLACSWWEIIDPETHKGTGYEFHVDWNNQSCEFHIDEITPGPYHPPFPVYEIEARQKITEIEPCDWFTVLDPIGFRPAVCTWWEVLTPQGGPAGIEFHVDNTQQVNGTYHIDSVLPGSPALIPWGPTYTFQARKKVNVLQQCEWYKVNSLTIIPQPGTWWRIIHPDIGDVEFHVDISDPNGTFHVDIVLPYTTFNPPLFELTAEQKFTGISPCDWFTVLTPPGFLPNPCSYWTIKTPIEWAGVKFHVDSNDGISKFHIDSADQLPPGPAIPPWNVTAEEYDPWYYKPPFADYVPSGMPDFDQRQWGTYNWSYVGAWSHCGPVAVANSLWWLDSEFESNPIPPPTINDHFSLVAAFGAWDDHDSRNVVPLVEKLAWFMDTDGRLTHLLHKGTSAADMQAGLTHYLSWSGVNPQGDVNGDGYVNQTDMDLVNLAFGSVPGALNWNLAADLNQNNIVNAADLLIVTNNMGQMGKFYEHTVNQPEFRYIEQEVENCQDVVLSIGYYIWTGSEWYREDGHFVTVAGVDSQDLKLAISDPIRDAFEKGLIPEGRIPVPHPHMPPEPPYTTHSNAAYVSQDIYSVVPIPPTPGLPGKWELANFPPEVQGFRAVIEDAVITSPLGIHDIAVTNLTTCKDGCTPRRTVCQNYTVHVNVTVANIGNFTENFNVTAYANTTVIGTQSIVGLAVGNQTIVYFVWNSSGYALGNYTLSAYAPPVTGETSILDNTYVDGIVKVTKVGDINGDGVRNMMDVGPAARGFMTTPGVPFYTPNADLTDDHKIDMKDIGAIARYCFQP